jgi:hypothetical protein
MVSSSAPHDGVLCDVLNLPAIELPSGKLVPILLRQILPKILDSICRRLLEGKFRRSKEGLPQTQAMLGRESMELNVYPNSRTDCVVNVLEQVGRHEHDTSIVFEVAEHDGDYFVAHASFQRPFREQTVSLYIYVSHPAGRHILYTQRTIEQEYGTPVKSKVESFV